MRYNSLLIEITATVIENLKFLLSFCDVAQNFDRINTTKKFFIYVSTTFLFNNILKEIIIDILNGKRKRIYYLFASHVIPIIIHRIRNIKRSNNQSKSFTIRKSIIDCSIVMNFYSLAPSHIMLMINR